MITIERANEQHIEGICKVCTDGYRETYKEMYPQYYIERVIGEFYSYDRVKGEIENISKEWNVWFVALENDEVVGAIGGGLTADTVGEVHVFYLDPNRRGEGIGTLLLKGLTDVQKELGITEQGVSVSKGNNKGIPFYEARGFVFQSERPSYANEEGEAYISNRYHRTV
ncbi:GNAT family N-acetyltransferase [Priestia taiwanensis]|uniref:N-acetyltransferase n=1 Tax=Priestia taiwanensis TaxID=1347902 RepID=A0A917AQ19_9BACI|nr:GNAT family N-acetyltransferase [Priestia taiwanensis]MBM7362919.1 GNAT superfamily N-acetyltransferase [Priestia taiwanensis]GGE66156.1 N-acetyltransferase [Priestia taiwanensis]